MYESSYKGAKVMIDEDTLQEFMMSHVSAMLFAETDDTLEPLNKHYDMEDISSAGWSLIRENCHDFLKHNYDDVKAYGVRLSGTYFLFRRNGHGGGFLDDGPNELAERLDQASERYGELMPVVNRDEQIEIMVV
jgi:hypothetical protein